MEEIENNIATFLDHVRHVTASKEDIFSCHGTAKFPDQENRKTIQFSQVSEPTSPTATSLHIQSTASKSHLKLASADTSRSLQVLACLWVVDAPIPQAANSPNDLIANTQVTSTQKRARIPARPELPLAMVMLDVSNAALALTDCDNRMKAQVCKNSASSGNSFWLWSAAFTPECMECMSAGVLHHSSTPCTPRLSTRIGVHIFTSLLTE